jgi:hypothetical protein
VEWNDINKNKSWVKYDFFALSLNNPKPIISFLRNNNLLDKMHFCHLTQYCRSKMAVEIARILKVSTSPADIKYRFGIQLHKRIKNKITCSVSKSSQNHKGSNMCCHYCDKNNYNTAEQLPNLHSRKRLALRQIWTQKEVFGLPFRRN